MHIRTLESALGTRLIDRQHRGAPLTEAGRAVYDFAVGVRRDLAVLRAQVRDLAGGQTGVVTFGAPQTVGSYILPELLAEFHQRHPAAQLRSRVLVSHAVAEAVLRGHLDFGIVNQPTAMAPSLGSELLWTEPMVIITPPAHHLARRAHVALANLAG